MTITEALQTVRRAPEGAPFFHVVLACGYTPLHVGTFLSAHLQRRLADRRVEASAGLYGDLPGALESLETTTAHGVAVSLEWADLDPRLGFRAAGAWGPSALNGIVSAASAALARIAAAVERIPAEIPVGVCVPTLPLPPLFHAPGWQCAEAELALESLLLEFASRIARRPGCLLVNRTRLAEDSPAAARFDLKSDLLTGLPYSLAHADAVASALALLLAPPPPKKGIVSDLDDTLWRGIAGEIGAENVAWDLAGHAQLHGLYQNLLASLAQEGVLVGIASKNDPAVVERVFERTDLLLRRDRVYPLEVHWDAKSGSLERILRAWNIGAESVVFVDDSPMELAEAATAHPGLECVLFPKNDYAAGLAMLRRLRDLFGKPRLSAEDAIRLNSIRNAAQFQPANGASPEAFLEQLEASITFDFQAFDDPRALELVNKTNQFNLNGARFTPADWRAAIAAPEAFLAVVSYEDKFGPLGKIAVIAGRREAQTLRIESWVMSCRAFSRRIEHQCLDMLYRRFAVDEIAFAFAATPKNGPLRSFFGAIVGSLPDAPFTLRRGQWESKRPPLYHRITEPADRLQDLPPKRVQAHG